METIIIQPKIRGIECSRAVFKGNWKRFICKFKGHKSEYNSDYTLCTCKICGYFRTVTKFERDIAENSKTINKIISDCLKNSINGLRKPIATT